MGSIALIKRPLRVTSGESRSSVEVREPGGKTEKEALKKLKHRRKELGAEDLGVYVCAGPEADRLTIEDLLRSLKNGPG